MIRENPSLFIPGALFAVISGLIVLAGELGGTYFGWKLLFLVVIIEPFFAAGFIFMAKSPGSSPGGFIAGGRKYYFRVLLPGLIIGFALLLTVILLLIPAAVLGLGPVGGLAAGAALGVAIPFVLFTWFFDTAAVLEDRQVFESIRRSIEVVMLHWWQAVAFFVVSLLVAMATGFIFLVAFTSAFFDRLEPLTLMNATDYQNFTPQQFMTIIGPDGIWVATALGIVWLAIMFTIVYAYKVAFFRKYSEGGEAAPKIVGEYDDKGRWYKY